MLMRLTRCSVVFRQLWVPNRSSAADLSQHYRFRNGCDMAVELPKLAARDGLENVAYGLYRVSDVPPTRFDQFAEALLRAGEGAYLHGESVLALFGLADVNPRLIKVAVGRRTRSKIPAFVELTQVKGGLRTTYYEGLESQSVADALLACRGRVETERLLVAAKQARTEGLLTTTEWQQVGIRSSVVRYTGTPMSVRSLEQRIRNLEGDDGLAQRRRVGMALVVVGQMLPRGSDQGWQCDGAALRARGAVYPGPRRRKG